jgi:hypothetical protein
MKWLPAALKARLEMEKARPDAKAVTDSVIGVYAHFDDVKFVFSKDPVDILSKTTSTCWESFSCEKLLEGAWGMGAFSDIANDGIVVYIVGKGGLRIGRTMLRWCEGIGNKLRIGMESKWYFCTATPEEASSFNSMGTSELITDKEARFISTRMSMAEATAFVKGVLRSKGVAILEGEETCTTPYEYGGFSDRMGKGNVEIHYR